MGLLPIEETAEKDVFITGFVKSGNTWLQTLTAALVFGIDVERCPDNLVQDLVPDVYDRSYYRRYKKVAFFKSHELPSPRYRRVVHIVRDGRDVMVSQWHHLRAMGQNGLSLRDLVESPHHYTVARWQEHVSAWMRNPHGAEMILLRYEDLRADPKPHVRRLAEFLGVGVDDAVLERAIFQCSFEQMKKREVLSGWDNKRWPKDKAFVRRGKVGSYRDEMEGGVLELFEKQAGDVLQSLGYR
jgi:hypothetical protein